MSAAAAVKLIFEEFMTRDLKMDYSELLVYALIYSYTKDGSGEFYASKDYLSKLFGMPESTAYKTLRALVSKGYICEVKCKGHSKRYKINSQLVCELKEREAMAEGEAMAKSSMRAASSAKEPPEPAHYSSTSYRQGDTGGFKGGSSYYGGYEKKKKYEPYRNFPDDPAKGDKWAEEAIARALERTYGSLNK